MKILFLTATYYPSTNGVAVSVKTTADVLIRKGHEVTVLAPENNESRGKSDNVIRYSSLPNPLNKDYPIPILPLNPKIVDLLLNKKYDIVHAHHPFHIAWFAEKFAKACDASFVFTYHTKYEDYADIYLKFLPKKYRKGIIKLGTDTVCKNVDLIIAPSKSLKIKLEKQYPYANVEAIPTGVSFSKTLSNANDRDYLKRTLKLKKDSIVLLSLSRLAEEKNIELVLNSLVKLPNKYHLVIVGSGPYENELKKLTEKLNVKERVTFLGRVAHEEVPKVLSSSDIFLFPSVTETQGLNLLEAMYFGLPVVAVRSDISKEWVSDEVGILTDNNVKKFTNAIVKVTKSCGKEKSRLIRKWALPYSLDNTSEALLAKYQEIIGKKRL